MQNSFRRTVFLQIIENCRRTLEIIEEQKILSAQKNERKELHHSKLPNLSFQTNSGRSEMEKHESGQVDMSNNEITEDWNNGYWIQII